MTLPVYSRVKNVLVLKKHEKKRGSAVSGVRFPIGCSLYSLKTSD